MFEHSFLTHKEITRIDDPAGRRYMTPAGSFLSVTTILKRYFKNEKLEEWKERVGKEEAEKISFQARNRGTIIHELCQKYLLNEENWKFGLMPTDLEAFLRIKKILDPCVNIVYGIELPLYSRILRAAGTCDLVCQFNDINSIVDFKTSKREKNENEIIDYFVQAAIYSFMVEELYNFRCSQLVIIMIIDHEPCKIFIKERKDYMDICEDIFFKNK